MADVNAGISDLRNWEKINFNPTITKDDDAYILDFNAISGAEIVFYKLSTKKNRNYHIILNVSPDKHGSNRSNDSDYIYISTIKPTAAYSNYLWKSDRILNTIEFLDEAHLYNIQFNSGNNDEIYISIHFTNYKDYTHHSVMFNEIKLNIINDGPDYLIESAYKTGYYFKDGEKIDTFIYMVLIRDEDILKTLPQEITPGSWAYTAAGKKVWQMDFDREWIPVFDEDE